MVTENSPARAEERSGPGPDGGKEHWSKHEPGATITNTAPRASISGKPMRCKCINFAGLMEFYIRSETPRAFKHQISCSSGINLGFHIEFHEEFGQNIKHIELTTCLEYIRI